MLPQNQNKTTVTTSVKIELEDNIPAELFAEYGERKKALDVTEGLIREALLVRPELTNRRHTVPMIIESGVSGRPTAIFAVVITIDGAYSKTVGITGRIDHSTLNLLLNNKILTDAEKRQLLRDRNLLPRTAQS